MSLTTFFICLVLFIAVTVAVWWLSGVPAVFGLLSRRVKADVREGEDKQHDPDLAFKHSASLWKGAIAAALASVLFSLLVTTSAHRAASSQLRSSDFKVGPAEAERIGARLADVEEWLSEDEESHVEPRRIFLRAFTGAKDATLEDEEAREHLAAFLAKDTENGALVAFVDLVARVSNSESSKDDLRSYCESSLTPFDLDVPSADVFLTRLQSEKALHTLRERLSAVLVEKPGYKSLIVAAYEKLRDVAMKHERVVTLFVGPIQMLTFGAFFLAVILLRMRQCNLAKQRNYNATWSSFAASMFASEGTTQRAMRARLELEGEVARREVIPLLPAVGDARNRIRDLEDQVALLRAFMASQEKEHLFAVGTASIVCKELIDELGGGQGAPDQRGAARDLVHQIVERNEGRIERVEYSSVQYLVYAIPSLGFIGTVLGIGAALGSADQVVRAADALAQANAITGVTSILGVAFDTTLVALVCGIVVSALISWVRSRESAFLLDIHQRVLARMIYGSNE